MSKEGEGDTKGGVAVRAKCTLHPCFAASLTTLSAPDFWSTLDQALGNWEESDEGGVGRAVAVMDTSASSVCHSLVWSPLKPQPGPFPAIWTGGSHSSPAPEILTGRNFPRGVHGETMLNLCMRAPYSEHAYFLQL